MIIQACMLFGVALFGYLHSYFGSTMLNRPLIMATLVGLVLGDLHTGIVVGSALELAFMGAVPIGASNPPDMTSGAVIATAFVILSGAETGMAVTIAIPVATLVGLIDNLLMMFVLVWAGHLCDKAADAGNDSRIDVIVRSASIGNKVLLASIVAIGFYFGSGAIEHLVSQVPAWFSHGMDVVAGILPALGIAMLARMIMTNKNWGFLLIGFALSAYLNMNTLGVALVGIGLVSILYYTQTQKTCEVVVDDNEF